MSTALEGIVRPFTDRDVTPTRYTEPGSGSVPPVRLQIGFRGQIKTLSWSISASVTFKMGQAHYEKPPNSEALQKIVGAAAGG